MATVVVTFFLISQLYVCNMDADCIRTQRVFSKREKRWSMNSQRLEQIVAELMKPISDVRRSFDTDLSALLEEYLTEAGLHALDASEDADDGAEHAAPNFAELALLLQQSASIYSRKVDFLYQHVLSVSDSLHNSTSETATASAADPATPSARRKRKASAVELQFSGVQLTSAGAACARRDAGARPPPTLPRAYDELAPRAPAPADRPLTDYDGEPIGLLADFHVCWRLQEGLLVEELSAGADAAGWRPPALLELRAALAARAPASPPPAASPPPSPSPSPPPSPPPAPPPCPTPEGCTTPPPCVTPMPFGTPPPCLTPPPFGTPPPCSTPLPTQPDKKERKRKNEVKMEDVVGGSIKLLISKELRQSLRRECDFSLPSRWIGRVLRARRAQLLAARRLLRDQQPRPPNIDFRGYDSGSPTDIGGFGGWSGPEAAAATAAALAASARRHDDSDDDGFFERSSLGDSDTSRADEHAASPPAPASAPADDGTAAWRARVLGAAAAAERRGADVHLAAATLLDALPAAPAATPAPAPALPFPRLLADVAREPHDVAKYFLATLFLANAGNVEVVQGPALSPGAFSVRLLSTDAARYRRTIAADAAPAPP